MPDASPVSPLEGDWPAQAADKIVELVGQVRDKTTGPLEGAARKLVYGTLAGLLGAMVLILLPIALLRAEVELVEWWTHGRRVWVAHAFNALLFTVAGAFLWSKRRAPARDS